MRAPSFLLPKLLFLALAGFVAILGAVNPLHAQDLSGSDGVIPGSYQGSGSFFNRQLGTVFRFNYHTEGYGQQDGIVALGSMKVFNLEDATIFLDGQATLNDSFGGGFNLGIGYRELVQTSFGFDPQRIHGVGFWTDGQSTSADNFFTQIGFSLESLGDSIDFRLNGYFPLDRTQRGDPVLTSLDELNYVGNNLFSGLEEVTIDTAHSVVDGEMAKRIQNLEAWAFIGGYQLGGGGVDATGYRVGVRGYAVPDLALSLQVTDDDVYQTNVMFNITWFVGRTTRRNQPCGTILDRFREPVLRNDFIATTSRVVNQSPGGPLTDTETNDAMRIVHVDSNAADGGDGTFEKPYRTLLDAQNGSVENDKILVHSGSTLSGSFVAKNGQDILGEGIDVNDPSGTAIAHVVSTVERGLVTLPETSSGSSAGAAPVISGAGIVFDLADDNAVNNFMVNGGVGAVRANGDASPSLANLDINGPSGNAIELINVTGTTVIENTVVIDDAVGTALFIDGGEEGMSLAATINDSRGRVLEIHNRTGGLITYSGAVTDNVDNDGTHSQGILIADNVNATINLTGTIDLDTNASNAVTVNGNNGASVTDAGTTITFENLIATSAAGNTVDIDDGGVVAFNNTNSTASITNTGTGNAVTISGDPVAANNATITIAADITNRVGGRSVDIQGRTANDVTFSGTVSDEGLGLLAQNNTGGNILFTDTVTANVTGANDGVFLLNNSGATLSFNGLDITTVNGIGFSAAGGGNLVVTSPAGNNTIETTGTGTGLALNGMAIDSGNVAFDSVAVNGAVNGIALTDLDGPGELRIGGGSDPGDGGTLTTTGTAITVDNVDSLLVTNVTVNNTSGAALSVTNQNGGTATFTGLNATTTNLALAENAIEVDGNSGGTIAFNDLTANTVNGNAVSSTNNNGATLRFNGMDITSTGAGNGFVANGGGTLAASGTNNISTTTGVGLTLDGMAVAGGGAAFSSVSVDGAASGVVLNELTGGQVTVGSSGTASSLANTTGDAIQITDVANADIVNVDVTGATGNALTITNTVGNTNAMDVSVDDLTVDAASGAGIVATHLGGEAFTFLVENSEINSTVNINANGAGDVDLTFDNSTVDTTGTDVAFTLAIGTSVVNADARIRGSEFTAANATAFDMDITSAASKTVNFLFNGNTVSNNSLSVAAEMDASQATILNATITDSFFNNANAAGDNFDIASNSATTVINMQLNNNMAGSGLQNFTLRELNASDFNIQERDSVVARNTGGFTFDSLPAGDVTDFDDIISVPLP